ncbi:MAG TPA: dihydroxyacetone kinase operon transcriptional regulator DhaR [Anaerolineae bacterium]|nr:dihydroxyacetone kinase operon transcriptional regulator DhaR [Anaerolineae bacterium]
MQSSNAHTDLARLTRAWIDFTVDSRLGPDIDPLVRSSWQRCAPRLNPAALAQWAYLSSDVLRLTLSQHASLRAMARPIMEDVHQFVEGTSLILVLVDSTACVLEMLGDKSMLQIAAALGLRQGAFLDESRIGTNAFASALIEGCPAQTVGPEHYLKTLHAIGCAAAPIYAVDGRLVGSIGLMAQVEQYSYHLLGIAVAASRAIENQLQADMFVREANAHASELNATMEAISDGVLAWSADGKIMHMNQRATQMLGLSQTEAVGRPLAEYVTLPEGLAKAVARGEELSDRETHFNVGGAQRDCLVSLRAVRDLEGEPTAYIATLRRLDQVRQLVTRQVGAQARLTLDDILGASTAMERVRRQAQAAAAAKACVLVMGESGTGKNVLARAIHNCSRRADGPFLAINCRAIPRALALGEFLGYEAGAYGTASDGRPSKFELADNGTLLLEEIESLPLDTQAALLRVIEAGDVIRLGGTRVIPVDVRIIAASTVDLEARVAEGTFRADLLFRLRSFVINIPPLRERPGDIPVAINRILERLSTQIGRPLALTQTARGILAAYPWPGNSRELESVLERAALLADGRPVEMEHLPGAVRQRQAMIPGKPLTEPVRSLVEAEKAAIVCAGRATNGNLSQTAHILGIGRTTLWRKMRELGLSADDFKTNTHN